MQIAIMSDSHDNWQNMEKAVAHANTIDCKVLLFTGDLIAPTKLEFLAAFKGRVVMTWGNNDGEKHRMLAVAEKFSNVEFAGGFFEENLENTRIFMNHYPKYAELAAKSGEYDLAIYGHDHIYHQELVGSCLLVNPGALEGFREPASWAIYDTETQKVKKVIL